MASNEFVASDTGSKLRVTCKDNLTKVAINLTGATVLLRCKIGSAAVADKTMTLLDQTTNTGQAEYQFLAGELLAGFLTYEIRITDSGGKVLTSLQDVRVPVKARLA